MRKPSRPSGPVTTRRLAVSTFSAGAVYMLGADGNAWYFPGSGASAVNCGPAPEFIRRAEAGLVRCRLDQDVHMVYRGNFPTSGNSESQG